MITPTTAWRLLRSCHEGCHARATAPTRS
jgi:hypothetical protein